ncbi:hypothetical protein NTGBS_40060 [Candidatus Nitrotoga sp. BS]|nr:hypothetical protein NTGBS_40060 [Candidatus Nitrotoga sp. BS]
MSGLFMTVYTARNPAINAKMLEIVFIFQPGCAPQTCQVLSE